MKSALSKTRGRSAGCLCESKQILPQSIVCKFILLILAVTLHPFLSRGHSAQAQIAVRTPDVLLEAYSVEEVNGRLWVAENGHVHVIEQGKTTFTLTKGKDFPYVNSLSYLKGSIWLATRRGAFRVEGQNAVRVSGAELSVHNVQLVGEEIWLATETGAYSLPSLKRIPDQQLDVKRIERIDEDVWLATNSGAYVVKGTRAVLVTKSDLKVRVVKKINGQKLLGTEKGLYRFDGQILKRVPDRDFYIKDIEELDGKAWVAAASGVYSLEADELKPLLTQELDVRAVKRINEEIWLAANTGLYRVDQAVSISVLPYKSDSWWKSVIGKVLGDNVWVEGVFKPEVKYIRNDGKELNDSTLTKRFEVILTPSKEEFDEAVRDKRYSPANTLERYISGGRTTIYMSVRDKWGNTFEPQPISGWVIPGPLFLAAVPTALWLAFLAATFLLAPSSLFFQRLLMNPFLRKYGSFGLVPLIMSVFPPARRHLLRRYFREVSRDKDFSEWQKRFVVPAEDFMPERMGKRIRDSRALFLEGDSGVGKTSYFRYLTGFYASNTNKQLVPRAVPVFLPLRLYAGAELKDVFDAQLRKFGQLTDPELTKWFLFQGNFLIFIDGLNEVDSATLNQITRFVDEQRKDNYFFLSSQVRYSTFSHIETVKFHALEEEKIKQIINLRLDKEKADFIIKQFEAQTYAEYGIPQDLELAIELVKKNQPLPPSRPKLYEATLRPIFDSWVQDGHLNYEELLCRRSYEMLSSQGEHFDRKDDPLPAEIRIDLVEDKFLVLREERFYFRHDLIRAYLAAKYFAPRWQQLLKEKVAVDSNWRSMLEFVILDSGVSGDTRELLYAILNKNTHLARDLFNWVESKHPDLCKDWADDFDRRYGKATRSRA